MNLQNENETTLGKTYLKLFKNNKLKFKYTIVTLEQMLFHFCLYEDETGVVFLNKIKNNLLHYDFWFMFVRGCRCFLDVENDVILYSTVRNAECKKVKDTRQHKKEYEDFLELPIVKQNLICNFNGTDNTLAKNCSNYLYNQGNVKPAIKSILDVVVNSNLNVCEFYYYVVKSGKIKLSTNKYWQLYTQYKIVEQNSVFACFTNNKWFLVDVQNYLYAVGKAECVINYGNMKGTGLIVYWDNIVSCPKTFEKTLKQIMNYENVPAMSIIEKHNNIWLCAFCDNIIGYKKIKKDCLQEANEKYRNLLMLLSNQKVGKKYVKKTDYNII